MRIQFRKGDIVVLKFKNYELTMVVDFFESRNKLTSVSGWRFEKGRITDLYLDLKLSSDVKIRRSETKNIADQQKPKMNSVEKIMNKVKRSKNPSSIRK